MTRQQRNATKNWSGPLALCALLGTGWSDLAYASGERVFPELSLGRQTAQYPANGLDFEWRNSLLVKTNSSELPEYEQTNPVALSGLRAFGAAQLTNRIMATADVYGAGFAEQESESTEGPPTQAEGYSYGYGGRSGFSILTDNALEFGAGIEARAQGERVLTRENAGLESTSRSAAVFLWRPGFSLRKIGPGWTAAAFYELGDNQRREVRTEVAGDVRIEESYVTLSPRFGGFFQASVGSQMDLGCELSFVRGNTSSLRAGSEKVFDNSYKAVFHLLFDWGGGSSLWLSLGHETASYAKQDFMAFENLPVTEVEATYGFAGGFYAGAVLTYSEDRQSTAEINRNFMLYGLGLRTGMKLPNP